MLDPATGETFTATRSGPATLSGEPIRSSGCDDLSRALVATGFGYEAAIREAQGRVIVRLLPRVRDVRRAGAAALDLCACACGRTDAYFERGLHHWDSAAGALICERAGLTVRPLEARDGLPSGIVVAPAAIIDQLEALVAPGPDPA